MFRIGFRSKSRPEHCGYRPEIAHRYTVRIPQTPKFRKQAAQKLREPEIEVNKTGNEIKIADTTKRRTIRQMLRNQFGRFFENFEEKIWRKGGDSNPRDAIHVNTLSRRAP